VKKTLYLLVLCILAMALLSSCGGNSGGGGEYGDHPAISADRLEHIEAERRNEFTIMRAGLAPNDPDSVVHLTSRQFEERFGKEVVFVISGYDDWVSKLWASIAVNDPIDIVYADVANYPHFAMQRWTQPIDTFITMDSGEYNLAIMENMFSFEGRPFVGTARGDGSPYVLYYNIDMLANEGIEDPRAIAERGEWDWRTFADICMRLTGSTGGDGVIDRWGYAGWYPWAWLGVNHTSLLRLNDQGLFELNIDAPAVFEALEYMQDMQYIRQWRGVMGDCIYASFYAGRNAFMNEYSWGWQRIQDAKAQGEFSFDVGVVRMPTGPNNTAGVNQIHAGGFSIVNGSNNPYMAGAWIDMFVRNANDPQYVNNLLPEDVEEYFATLRENGFSNAIFDSPIDNGSVLIYNVIGGTDIAQALEAVRNAYQAIIDEVNKPPVEIERRPFTEIFLTFDNDAQGILRYDASFQDGMNYGVDWVADGIEGGSIILRNDYEDNDDWVDVAHTDIHVHDIVGWQNFKITFDYRYMGVPDPQAAYELTLMNDEGLRFASRRLELGENPSGRFEIELPAAASNSRTISLLFTAYLANDLMIDNFRMEAIERLTEE
jgi:ABC-type glycerol-3-phosphate transport system substrate-binding protein